MKKKRRVIQCGRCAIPMLRSKERINIFFGHVCRACAQLAGTIDQIAEGLARIMSKESVK